MGPEIKNIKITSPVLERSCKAISTEMPQLPQFCSDQKNLRKVSVLIFNLRRLHFYIFGAKLGSIHASTRNNNKYVLNIYQSLCLSLGHIKMIKLKIKLIMNHLEDIYQILNLMR